MRLGNFPFQSRNYHWIKKKDRNDRIISGLPPMDAISLGEFYNHSKGKNTLVIVGKDAGRCVSLIELESVAQKVDWGTLNGFFKCLLWINYITVDKSKQGKGIGRELIAYAERIGECLNCHKILLDAVEMKEGFYSVNGFHRRGAKPFFENGWGKVIPMEKEVYEFKRDKCDKL